MGATDGLVHREGSISYVIRGGQLTIAWKKEDRHIMDAITSIVFGDIARVAGLGLAMIASLTGGASIPIVLDQLDAEVGTGCALMAPEVEAEPWVRTELFFGMAKPDGTTVSNAEWETFLDTEITPRFPDGLTVLSGNGQWQGENDVIVEERSKIVILLYPREAVAESNAEIEEIRSAYERRFQQESVLRADDDRPVCTSF
jgi:hypothetical protein